MNIEFESNCTERLIEAENDHREEFSATDGPEEEKLILYHFVGCPFCSIARSPIDRLGIDVELRDIFENPRDRDDLIKAQGRATVPVLRITSPGGEQRWMPESRDIVEYLEARFE
jgi:glutaredoxin